MTIRYLSKSPRRFNAVELTIPLNYRGGFNCHLLGRIGVGFKSQVSSCQGGFGKCCSMIIFLALSDLSLVRVIVLTYDIFLNVVPYGWIKCGTYWQQSSSLHMLHFMFQCICCITCWQRCFTGYSCYINLMSTDRDCQWAILFLSRLLSESDKILFELVRIRLQARRYR